MVARELGVTSKDVREMESRMAAQDMTFDLSSDIHDSDSQPMAPVLYLQDKSSNFADGIEDDNWEEQAANRLTDAMKVRTNAARTSSARWLDEIRSPRCRNWLTVTVFPLNVCANWKERDEKTSRRY